ncbi:hypothetical protein ABPG77_010978 [Micractinium sp. CCAP 211/92]
MAGTALRAAAGASKPTAAAATLAGPAAVGLSAASGGRGSTQGRERWTMGPLLRFNSTPLEAAFQQALSGRRGVAELCWSALACTPSVLWELRQRRPLHFVVLGLAVVLLPLCAAWLRARAPGRRAAQQAALVAHMVFWAALWAVSQRASAGLPPRASSALCSAAAPEAAALLVILLRLASHSWVPLLAVYPHLVGMSLPAAAAGQAAAAIAAAVAGGAACKQALAACPADGELFVRAAAQLDSIVAAALPLGAPVPARLPHSDGRCWDAAAACRATTLLVHVTACGLLSLGLAYAAERQQRQEFAARQGQWQAEAELQWRRVPAWHGVLQCALAACVAWLPLSTWLRQ